MSEISLERVAWLIGQRKSDLAEIGALKQRIEELEAALKKIAQHDMQAIALDALRPGERTALAEEKKK